MVVRSEHQDLEAFLLSVTRPQERQRVGFVSFTQWRFALAALAETALTLHEMGSETYLALWSENSPMKDVGWSTYGWLTRWTGSQAPDRAIRKALMRAGVPKSSFVDPPIRWWKAPKDARVRKPLNRSMIRALGYRGSPMGRAMLQIRPDTETPITDAYFWPQRLLDAAAQSYAWVFDQTLELIKQQDLTCIIVYNGRFLHDRAASAAGEAAGIKVLYYDTGGLDTDFDLTDNVTHDWSDLQRRMLDLYQEWPVPDRDTVGESWFAERIAHTAPDNALFVESQQSGYQIELPPAEKVIVFFSSSGDEIAELELDWGKFIGDQPEALRSLAEAVRDRPGWALVVRSHPHKRMKPKQDVVEWLEAVKVAKPDLHIDHHSPVDSYTLMRQADVVVTYGSTTGVEAAYAGKPVIVMGPCAYDELGCAVFAGTPEDLAKALDNAVPGSRDAAVSYGLMMRRRGFSLNRVTRVDDAFIVSDVVVSEPSVVARKVSHAWASVSQWYLERR